MVSLKRFPPLYRSVSFGFHASRRWWQHTGHVTRWPQFVGILTYINLINTPTLYQDATFTKDRNMILIVASLKNKRTQTIQPDALVFRLFQRRRCQNIQMSVNSVSVLAFLRGTLNTLRFVYNRYFAKRLDCRYFGNNSSDVPLV